VLVAIVSIVDGNGNLANVSWQAQDVINDNSGALGAGAVGNARAFQQVLAANITPPGPGARAGMRFQNTSQNPMLLNEVNEVTASSWIIGSGESFPPPGYPVPTGALYVMGTAGSQIGDTFACREWVNAAVA
jgi:hypothetical protein